MSEFLDFISSKFYYTFIYEDRWSMFLSGLVLTLTLVAGAFILGTILGVIITALKHTKIKWLKKLVNAINWFVIEIPTTVLLLIFAYLIFNKSSLSTVVISIFAFSLKAGAYMADIFTSALQSVNSGENEAARSLGLSKMQAFFSVTLPQAVKNALPVYQNQFVLTLQDTSVVGYIALQDLTRASNIVTSRTYDAIFPLITVSIIYILVGFIATKLLALLAKEHHLKGGDFID